MKRSFYNGNTFDSTQIIAAPTRIPTTAGYQDADPPNVGCKRSFGCVIGDTNSNNQQSGILAPNFPYLAIDSANNLHVTWTGYSSTSLTNIM